MRVTVFGLGEAGSLIAADLAEAGSDVHGYDPADVPTPEGVTRHEEPGPSAVGSSLVIAATAAGDAPGALAQACDEMDRGVIYADVSTSPPSLKEDLAGTATSQELLFVDVALMGTVPGNGVSTPAFASGPGAARFAEFLNAVGGNVEVLGDRPGDAAARKLLRSVVTKGLTSVLIESLKAAEAHGSSEWLWDHLIELLTDADHRLLERLIGGTPKHVDRRISEMESARAFLQSLRVSPTMTAATVEALQQVKAEGMPRSVGGLGAGRP